MVTVGPKNTAHSVKMVFFSFVAICLLIVLVKDESFLFIAADPEWAHIQPFKWPLLFHGIFGALALVLGSVQFSDRIRRNHVNVHRWLGRLYVGSVAISAPIAFYIGTNFQPKSIQIEQIFQSGFWFVSTAIALICILKKHVALHKLWMMRSYGFCLVFLLSRVPDAAGVKFDDQLLADMLWSLVITAIIVPDLIRTFLESGKRQLSVARQ